MNDDDDRQKADQKSLSENLWANPDPLRRLGVRLSRAILKPVKSQNGEIWDNLDICVVEL